MKILQVIPFFSPHFGGSVNSAYNLSKELSRRGHKVTIITTDFEFDKNYSASIENEGVQVLKFKCKFNFASFFYSPSINTWLDNNINKYDIIHLHLFRSYQNSMVQKYARRYRVPYLIQTHGSLPLIIEKQALKKIYDLFWGRKLLNNASRLIAVSNIEYEQIKQFEVDENIIKIIYNGIDFERFTNIPSPDKFKLKYHITTRFMILFLGRIHKRKGIKFLIEAFKQISDDITNITLVIVGPDDGYKTTIENLVNSLEIQNVKFIDYIKNVSEAYSAADIVIYPAIHEIFGLVPFEAIACGTPVIVTNDCGCGEIIQNANCGYVVKYGDIIDLKEKIHDLILDPELGSLFVGNGKNFILNNLNWQDIGKKLEAIYMSLLKKTY